MSLTSFLKLPDVREKFRQEFVKPRVATGKELLAPPLSKRYSTVGTAFDYLLRFYLQRLHSSAKQRRWVAEAGLKKLGGTEFYDIDAEEWSFLDDDGIQKTGRTVLKRAQAAHDRYLASGKITDSLLKGVIGLAHLDVIYRSRSGFVDENLGVAHREDVRDLRKLISLVKPEEFRTRRVCLLNPTFGIGSRLIGGADADLFIDGMLIDIKATKKGDLKREYFDQLLGYLALHEIWGLKGLKRKPKISKLAIYSARYAYWQVLNVKDVIDVKTFPSFLQWFKERVEQMHKRRTKRSTRRGVRRSARIKRQ